MIPQKTDSISKIDELHRGLDNVCARNVLGATF